MRSAESLNSMQEAKPQPLPPLVGLRDLRQKPPLAAVAPEEWMDEVRSILTETFRSQLAELRDFCEEMQSETKDVIRKFVESSTVTEQALPCRPSKAEQLCVGGSSSRPRSNLAPKQETFRAESKEESFGWSKSTIVPIHCEAHNLSAVWHSTGSRARSPGDMGKEAMFHGSGDSTKPSQIPGIVTDADDGLTVASTSLRPDALLPFAAIEVPAGGEQKKSTRDTTISKCSGKESGVASSSSKAYGRGTSAVSLGTLGSRMSKKHKQRSLARTFKREDGEAPAEVPDIGCLSSLCKAVQILVHSPLFDYGMGALLLGNAICMGIGVNIAAVNNLVEAPARYRFLDMVFNIVFTIELALRILAFREVFFKIDGWRWNVFDVFIVSIGWVHAITGWIVQKDSVIDKVGVIRLLRLGRIARLIRMVRLIPELKSMVYLIMASMSSFLWALVLMMMGVYCMAVYFTELAGDMIKKGQVENADQVREQWGSVFQSILSLYMGITGGDDWRNFIEPFKAESAQYVQTTVIFALYIAFSTLVMLNLVTGVFVEGAQRIIRDEKDFEIMNMAVKVFAETDDDESQDITLDEWNFQLHVGALDEYINAIGITRYEATHLFRLLDLDGSESINIVEFVRGCLRLRGPAKAMDTADMLHQLSGQNFQALARINELQLLVQGFFEVDAPELRKSESLESTMAQDL